MRSGIAWMLLAAGGALGGTVPGNQVRRLTHSQYNHTVRDLLGDQTNPADDFPQEDFLNGFKNQSAAQDIPPLLADAYAAAAERLARNAFQGGQDNGHLLPCRPRSAADAACAGEFIRRFGLRAFRRPLAEGEGQRYQALFASEARRTGDFLQGAQAVVEAMLQSPKFLFHLEGGSYAIASRLSYFLWDTMPDDALLASAGTGELETPTGLQKAIRRLMADPRARQAVDEFISEWLRFDLALGAVKDHEMYPQFTPELAQAMTEETRRLIADVVWNDRNFLEIFTARYAFLNSDLAAIYGLPAPANEFDKVVFPASSDRAGILGEALFLTATSKPGDTSPTVRGLSVRELFLCQQVPDPPPGTNSNLPPISAARPLTNRERLKMHVGSPICAGCHSLMDPIGLGLERYDAIGRYREQQTIRFMPDHEHRKEKPVTVTLPLDPRGSITGMAHAEFSSSRELGELLAASPLCGECMVRQLFRYAWGRKETSADAGVIQKGVEVFRGSQFRWKELMMFLASSMAIQGGGS
ncbi:MAG TPA: DUF1592 domain-containing protein [Bryobacteraceae bacterium]|nr:DUF1592 domain-containing protein [Bryobacteraceae bacterium]